MFGDERVDVLLGGERRVLKLQLGPTWPLIPAPPGSQWFRVQGVRWGQSAAEPLCFTTVFVHSRFGAHLKEVRTHQGPIYNLIEARSGERIAEAVQEISAEPMPRQVATALKLKTGTPSLRFVRRYLDASGAPMVSSINWHAADRFVYRMRLRRDDQRLP